MFKFYSYAYQQPFRQNFELWQTGLYTVAGLSSCITAFCTDLPSVPFYIMTAVCGINGCLSAPDAYRLRRLQKNLGGRALTFITLDELKKVLGVRNTEMWLGYGFEWEQSHVQRTYEITKRDWSTYESYYRESTFERLWRQYVTHKPEPESAMGKAWIHGLEPKEKEIWQPLKHVEGHSLIIGTTGAGKTRMFDILITQCILRGETVIIIDPKGDKELADNALRACVSMGQKDRFIYFNPAFPEKSARINPLSNFSRVTEIASRISALMQSANGGNDPFKAFSWQAINNIAQGLSMIRCKPSLVKIKHYLEGGAQALIVECINVWLQENNITIDEAIEMLPSAAEQPKSFNRDNAKDIYENGVDTAKAKLLVFIFKNHIVKQYPNSELEGLVSMFEHDETHFSKMVANLLPILNMLTSGNLGALLSPDPDADNDSLITNTAKIISQSQVAYIGLDSLTDSTVGSAIGSMILSDLTSVAGERYNYGEDLKPVNIFVDEAAETINDPMIAMLNKGRGAKMRLFVATQTIADFSARLGSKDKAMQVLGNINNTISLRTIDPETQEFICESMPKTRISYVMHGQNAAADTTVPVLHGAGISETLKEEEADYFPAALLGSLPNLEYIAKISGGKIIKGRLPILCDDHKNTDENNRKINQKSYKAWKQQNEYPKK
jgi:conjugal transfer pilus assembly protein TraD